ncbi:MAG: winged helix-turn-helix domain-containing protein [Myxococcota bacterium]
MASSSNGSRWTFLSNHAHVMLCLLQDREPRVRDIAERVGLTERAVQRILLELEEAGALDRCRVGRRNRYELHLDVPLRHPMESDHTIGDILRSLTTESELEGFERRSSAPPPPGLTNNLVAGE